MSTNFSKASTEDQGETIRVYHKQYRSNLDKLLSLADGKGDPHDPIISVARLEDGCSDLSHRIDVSGADVNRIRSEMITMASSVNGIADEEYLTADGKKGVLAAKGAWAWIIRLHDCTRIHLVNAANYHQFFLEVDEFIKAINSKLPALIAEVEKTKYRSNADDGKVVLKKGQEIVFALGYWRNKLVELFHRSHTIVPVYRRTQKQDIPLHVRSLCAYKNAEIEFKEGQDLLLIDNSNPESWRVKATNGHEGQVPPPCVLIPPPDTEALGAAFKLMIQLLGIWQKGCQGLGHSILQYLYELMQKWQSSDINALAGLSPSMKSDLATLLKSCESTFGCVYTHDKCFRQFEGLIETINAKGVNGSAPATSSAESQEIQEQVVVSKGLVEVYKELMFGFERYAMLCQMSRSPDLLIVPGDWQEYGQRSLDDIMSNCKSSITDKICICQNTGQLAEEVCTQEHQTLVSSEPVSTTSTTETAATEDVTSAESSTKQVFVIDVVADPVTDEDLDYKTAVEKGILLVDRGLYMNPSNGESMTIADAMAQGFIVMSLKSVEVGEEKKSAYGIVTITTVRDSRQFKITSVIDTEPDPDIEVSYDEAVRKNILRPETKEYYDIEHDELMTYNDAIMCGLVNVEYDDAASGSKEEVQRTYIVHGVVDHKKKGKIPYDEAIQSGIFDKENGKYIHNVTGEEMPLSKAIQKGFIKARLRRDGEKDDLHQSTESQVFKSSVNKVKGKLSAIAKMGALSKK